ncbi:MAG: L-aspartate oxidase [Spirochaetales bacterium]
MKPAKSAYDVLVIGAGIGGLSCAISAAEAGLSVAVVSKEENLAESNTYHAQGGIVERGTGDTPELLYEDIVKAGVHLNNREAVRFVVEEGPSMVREYLVEKVGVPFNRTPAGELAYTQEAAHSIRRILFAQDSTGKAIETSLLDYAARLEGIDLFPSTMAVDILTNCHNSQDPQERYRPLKAIGAYLLDVSTLEIYPLFAPNVVLAAGGVGNLFLHTSNPKGATGDGIAMALRLGCEVINAEYLQFHPTILYHRDKERFLITEALRGEGARLRNRKGELFMARYHPELQDLAPRDEVSRAIFREMALDGSGYVLLDATGCRMDLKERFPMIFEVCASLGLDIRKEPIPVVPAAHYFCGGIKVDLDGRTTIDGLYAVGENACNGIHGANRLASISLLESLSFGIRCGRYIAAHPGSLKQELLRTIPDWVYPRQQEEFDPVLISNDLLSIQTLMWNYVGIIRTRKRLLRALSDLNYLNHRIEQFYKEARVTRDLLELRNAVSVGMAITRAALRNEESIGCHYRED